MPTLIWKKNSNWFPQGDRQVRCFDSGLVLLQQTFIAPVGTNPPTAGTPPNSIFEVGDPFPGVTTPCIDGAYIFPAPSYQDNGNGFTECVISAYGRTNGDGNKTFTKSLVTLVAKWAIKGTIESSEATHSKEFQAIADKLVWKFVMPKTAAPNIIPITLDEDGDPVEEPMKIYRLNGINVCPLLITEFVDLSGPPPELPLKKGLSGVPSITKNILRDISLAECVNYGAFDEWTVVYDAKYEGGDFHFGTWNRVAAPEGEDKTQQIVIDNPIIFTDFFDFDMNNSEEIIIVKIENTTNATSTLMNLEGTTSTFLGGTLTASASAKEISYQMPACTPPNRNWIQQLSWLPDPPPYISGPFYWGPFLVKAGSDDYGPWKRFEYRLGQAGSQITPDYFVEETFLITIKNELNQQSSYGVSIKFVDPPLLSTN